MIKEFINANPYIVLSLLAFLGAAFRWWQEIAQNGAPAGFSDYWLKETPGHSGGVFLGIVGTLWGVVEAGLFDVDAGAAPIDWRIPVGMGALIGYGANAGIYQGALAKAKETAGQAAGFLRLQILPLILAALLVAAFVAGCAIGPRAAAPKDAPESIEAASLLMEKISDKLVELSCTQFNEGRCVEPGKPLMPVESLKIHERIEDAHGALVTASALGAGEIGECLGQPRSQAACVSAVGVILIEIDNYLITLGSPQP